MRCALPLLMLAAAALALSPDGSAAASSFVLFLIVCLRAWRTDGGVETGDPAGGPGGGAIHGEGFLGGGDLAREVTA